MEGRCAGSCRRATTAFLTGPAAVPKKAASMGSVTVKARFLTKTAFWGAAGSEVIRATLLDGSLYLPHGLR